MPARPLLLAIAISAGAAAGACGARDIPQSAAEPATDSAAQEMGAVTSLTEHPIPPGPVRLEELLRGRAAGLEVRSGPDGEYSLRIRGISSLRGTGFQEPLVIVDGVQILPGTLKTALAGLTRDDIVRVDILKDVASTAIYGIRGAGGVILIATNR